VKITNTSRLDAAAERFALSIEASQRIVPWAQANLGPAAQNATRSAIDRIPGRRTLAMGHPCVDASVALRRNYRRIKTINFKEKMWLDMFAKDSKIQVD
jgi:hypothetical protein